MIRFIRIGDQIEDDENQFAFFDTITDKFLEFDGAQVFDSWDEFLEYFTETSTRPLSRFESLYH